jgi:hypothetical protein
LKAYLSGKSDAFFSSIMSLRFLPMSSFKVSNSKGLSFVSLSTSKSSRLTEYVSLPYIIPFVSIIGESSLLVSIRLNTESKK